MRKSLDLDHLLENAVAEALGLDRPHPDTPRRLRSNARRSNRRHEDTPIRARHEHTRAAA
jgi:hypothetical protein